MTYTLLPWWAWRFAEFIRVVYRALVTNLPFLQILTGKPPFHYVPSGIAVMLLKAKGLGLPTNCDYSVEYTEIWEVIERCAACEPKKRPLINEVVRSLDDLTNPIYHRSSHCILAHHASSHASLSEPALVAVLTNLQFEGQYMMQVGFNETSLRERMLVEEIYLLLNGELASSEDHICTMLGAVFAPFPGIVYTPLRTYHVPIDPQSSVGRLLEFGDNIGNMLGSGGAGSAFTPQLEDTSHGNQKTRGGQNTHRQGRQKEGGREPGDEGGGSSDSDDESKGKGGDLGARRKGKEPSHGPRLINIPLDSTVSIQVEGIVGFQEVTAAASIYITVRFILRFGIVQGVIKFPFP